MKTITTFIILFSIFLTNYAQNTSIPDVNFEKALIDLGYDTGSPDGLVPTANINTITSLSITNKNIVDLQGIQDFTGLNALYCYNNNIGDLKISNNKLLQTFNCDDNNINSLDVSNNTILRTLSCSNNALSELDLTKNPNLVFLEIQNNQLISMNMKNGNNSSIQYFDARNNPNLKCIEVDNSTYSTTNWTLIDPQTTYSENCGTNTQMAHIPDDNFEKRLIDLGYDSGAPDDYVPIVNIDKITSLDVSGISIASLSGIEYFTALTSLDCSDNNLTELNLSKNTALINLLCKFNSLANLDLSQNSALKELSCRDNQLTTLNVKNGNNTNITNFDAENNPNLNCIAVDNAAYSISNWLNIDTQTIFSENCGALGIADFLEATISAYPNPTKDLVNVSHAGLIDIVNIKTFDVLGRQLQETNHNFVNLGNFQAGLYFLKMQTNKGVLMKKVIKN